MRTLIECYIHLLQLPFGETRMNLQPAMAAIRDEIARLSGHSPEEVQSTFELATEISKVGE